MKNNKRITRNSYKRKIILFGVLMFLSIALMSTGFAAWVMSSGAKDETEGGIDVSVVADTNLKFEDIKLYKLTEEGTEEEVSKTNFTFNFDPKASDTTGRVRSKEGDPTECLTLIVKGFVSPKTYLSNVQIKLEIPEGLKKAVSEGYIKLPECAALKDGEFLVTLKEGDNELLAERDGTEKDKETGRLILNYKIEFKWGDKFKGENPGIYYDLPEASSISDKEVKETLNKMRALIYGYEYDENATDEELKIKEATKFKLILKANIN